MEIETHQPTCKGPAERFTGDVWVDVVAQPRPQPHRMTASIVRFAPGARTAWHLHALGQTLRVTDGIALVQAWGGHAVVVRSGETVHTLPEEWHWHGTTESTFMTPDPCPGRPGGSAMTSATSVAVLSVPRKADPVAPEAALAVHGFAARSARCRSVAGPRRGDGGEHPRRRAVRASRLTAALAASCLGRDDQGEGTAASEGDLMAVAQTHVTLTTPMGATLLPDGATFRFWAPRAQQVYLVLDPRGSYQPNPADELVRDPASGHWVGFAPGVTNGTTYLFWVVGEGSSGFKRDPWARELGGSWPQYVCVVRALDEYPWHDADFRTPDFADLTVYELHVGVFSAVDDQGDDRRPHRVSKLLDVLDRVEYLAALGVRAVQPLPVVEFRTTSSQGYNGTDIFSPETDYCVADGELADYLVRVNRRLAGKGFPPLTESQLTGHVNQLKAFVDVLHLYGIAVVFDVVYNHAGGGDLDDQSLDHVDRPASPNVFNNAYFQPADFFAPVFAFAEPEVASFLVQNAVMFLSGYHADGLRFDEVGVITDHNGGRLFCQGLTSTLRWVKPQALLLAEYWRNPRAAALWAPPDGLGFDAGYSDELRLAVREVIAAAATGPSARLDIGRLAASLELPWGVPARWREYTYLENHDLLLADPSEGHNQLRMVELAGGVASGWWAHSRCRAATGLLLTAPGIPALFMGEEFLESRRWSDNPDNTGLFIQWDALSNREQARTDFLRCTQGLLHLRQALPALRSEGLHVFHVNVADRVLAFHRWVPGEGEDVVVVLSLHEEPFDFGSYRLGFPAPGRWTEVFNTDAYPGYPQQWVRGNPDGVIVDGPPMHDLPASAGVTIPPNGLLVFAR